MPQAAFHDILDRMVTDEDELERVVHEALPILPETDANEIRTLLADFRGNGREVLFGAMNAVAILLAAAARIDDEAWETLARRVMFERRSDPQSLARLCSFWIGNADAILGEDLPEKVYDRIIRFSDGHAERFGL